MSVRQAPPRAPLLQQRQRPEVFWEPAPNVEGGEARLAAVLAAGRRHAEATGGPGDGMKNLQNAANKVMAAQKLAKAAPKTEPVQPVQPKGFLQRQAEKAGKAIAENATKAGDAAKAKAREAAVAAQKSASAYIEEKKQDIIKANKWREADANALKDLRKKTARAAAVLREEGSDEQKKKAYEPLAELALEAYRHYRKTYWAKTREGIQHANVNITDDVLKALYKKYEREVAYNDTRGWVADPRGAPETISCGFDDDDALLAAEMEAAGTALCCDEDEDDTGDALVNGFLPAWMRRMGLDDKRKQTHDEIVNELLALKKQYKADKKSVNLEDVKSLLSRYRRLHNLPRVSNQHGNTDDANIRAQSFLNPFGTIRSGFEPGIDQEEVGCGWSAMRGMQYPCAMVFTMIGHDGVTRLYCASGKPPSAYDNASQLRPLSDFNSELREMLEELSGMWPGSPSYTNYVLVPAGQSEPEPEPEPATTTQLRIPISELEGEGGAEKLTEYVMNWLKQMNVKINEDKTTNTELNKVTTRRGAVGVPINAGRGSRFRDTEDTNRVARQLQAAFRARRDRRAREAAAAAAQARAEI